MGELQTLTIAERLASGESIQGMVDIPGTLWMARKGTPLPEKAITIPSYEAVSERIPKSNRATEAGKRAYAEAFALRLKEENPITGRPIIQHVDQRTVVQNPPARPLSQAEFDRLYELPYTLDAHPDYQHLGGVPALREVRFSLTSNRGCFGSCSFCAIESHQGRMIQTRSKASLVKEAKRMTCHPAFKGHIHDLGGPTANFQGPSCERQAEHGPCRTKACLHPAPCSELLDHHKSYLATIKAVEAVPGVKRLFIRSGLRYDYLLAAATKEDRKAFIDHLARNNVSGQLRVAPEHVASDTLDAMGKPSIDLLETFSEHFRQASQRANKEQYLLPYYITSHPGCTLDDAIELALYVQRSGFIPNEIQDFYPTPGTVATCMYYTGLDPRPGRKFAPVYVPKGRERRLQRALLHHHKRENRALVLEALAAAKRKELGAVLLPRNR